MSDEMTFTLHSPLTEEEAEKKLWMEGWKVGADDK